MNQKKRHMIQAIATFVQNGWIPGFLKGTIYRGAGKQVCVPGLNCYSCPGALGSCPIGSLQAVVGGSSRNISYYVMGLILLFGSLFGRLICGFLCPFGFLQDLLHKIPGRKVKVPEKIDKKMRYIKYLMLAGVFLLPVLITDPFGIGVPYFCKYVCPAGTLEGGISLMITNKALREAAGFLFSWKVLVLLVILVSSVLIYRPFCKYLCPLGGAYGLCNKVSLCRMKVVEDKCIQCGKCMTACKMGVDVLENINSAECIRCGACVNQCPTDAIVWNSCRGYTNQWWKNYKNRSKH